LNYRFCNLGSNCAVSNAQFKKNMKANIQVLNKSSLGVAKEKLSQHRSMGTKSNLSIFQVAHLMDTLKSNSDSEKNQLPSLFFSVGLN